MYLTADLLAQGYEYEIDMQLDLSDMASIQACHFDTIIACDVLEHVPEHLAAIAEIFRTLKPGGCAVLTVPQQDGLLTTREDPGITDPLERERLYGQRDHLRMYGKDFTELLKGAGFDVTAIAASSFPPELVEKYVLFPPIPSHHPLVTNYRTVFFAFKPNIPALEGDEPSRSTTGNQETTKE